MKKIMVIEDDHEIRGAMLDVLEVEGHQVVLAHDGKEALETLRAMDELPDLIILDLMMPVMNGFEFRQEQMKDPRLSSIPVSILSADGHVNEKAENMGVHHFLKKPVDIDNLIHLIEDMT